MEPIWAAAAAMGAPLCGFAHAGKVMRVRNSTLVALVAAAFSAALLCARREAFIGAFLATSVCLVLFGTTYGLPPDPGFDFDGLLLFLAVASIIAALVLCAPRRPPGVDCGSDEDASVRSASWAATRFPARRHVSLGGDAQRR